MRGDKQLLLRLIFGFLLALPLGQEATASTYSCSPTGSCARNSVNCPFWPAGMSSYTIPTITTSTDKDGQSVGAQTAPCSSGTATIDCTAIAWACSCVDCATPTPTPSCVGAGGTISGSQTCCAGTAPQTTTSCNSYTCTGTYTRGVYPDITDAINICGAHGDGPKACSYAYVCTSGSCSTKTCGSSECSGTGCSGCHYSCVRSCSSSSTVTSCVALPNPSISVSPASQDFGIVYTNNYSGDYSFTVTNTGGAASGCTYSVTNTTIFTLNNGTCGSTIAAGGSCTATIKARPQNAQDYNATFTASCTGTSASSSLVVHGGVPPLPELTISAPASYNVTHNYPNGDDSHTFDVTVTNSNSATSQDGTGCSITLSGITNGGSFSKDSRCTNVSIAKNASCTTTITYSLPNKGQSQVVVTAACSNGGNSPSKTFYATRNVQADFSIVGSYTFATPSPAMIDLEASSDQLPNQEIEIENGGDSICYNPTFSASNTNFHIFSNTCGSSIGVGAKCKVTFYGKPDPDQNPTPAPGPTTTQERNTNIQVSCGTNSDPYIIPLNNDLIASARLYAQICPPGSVIASPSTCDCSGNTPPALTFNRSLWSCVACPLGSILDSAGFCHCPFGHENVNDVCRPILPSTEFIRDSSGLPVCSPPNHSGALYSRIPTTYSLTVSEASGPILPRTNNQTTMTTGTTGSEDIKNAARPMTYLYSLPFGAPSPYPLYAYHDQPHCACVNHTDVAGIVSGPLSVLDPLSSNSKARFAGDTLDFIASVDQSGRPNRTYGMVTITNDNKSDGRLGSIINATTGVQSQCACPNVNEIASRINSTDPQSGVTCAPPVSLRDDLHVAFAPFDPATDAVSGSSQVFTTEPTDGSGNIIRDVSLPVSQAAPNSLKTYRRHIWKCQLGYTLDLTSKTCTIDWSTNQCDSASPLGGADWTSTINKKLACCMNQFDSATTNSSKLKFDCLDNSTTNYSNFNALWAADDADDTGAQLNALLLMSANGKPLTGFYTLDGARCNEFSEFSSIPIQPGTVNPLAKDQQQVVAGTGGANEFVANGSPLPTPSGQGWTDMIAGLGGKAKAPNPSAGTATEIAKARRCPVLVRAAAVYTCPKEFAGSNAPRFTAKDDSSRTRCLSAENIKVHMRVEQVFQIAGQAPLQTTDTVMDRKNVGSVNMEQIIREKNKGACPPGTVPSSGGCRY